MVLGEKLVPIRLDLESDGYKLRDTFVWPLDNNVIAPESFAELTCKDFDLPVQIFKPLITASMKDQIQDFLFYTTAATVESKPTTTEGPVSSRPCAKDQLAAMSRLRVLIRLDMTIDHTNLVDQFEWSLGSEDNEPEMMADTMTAELGLSPEFRSAIAHSIREQCFWIKKALMDCGYGLLHFSIPTELYGVVSLVSPSSQNHLFRHILDLDLFTPKVSLLSEFEIERLEQTQERESRASSIKKNDMSWSFSEPPKIIRTPLSYRGTFHRSLASQMEASTEEDLEDDFRSGHMAGRYASSNPLVKRFKDSLEMATSMGHLSAAASTLQSCTKCLLAFPSQQLIKIADKYYCIHCRSSLGLASQVNVARLIPSHLHLLSAELQQQQHQQQQQQQQYQSTGSDVRKSLTKIYQKLEPEPLTRKEEALIPEWMKRARSRVLKRYPNDFFSIVIEEGEPKIKCYDCVKIYASGPNQTLKNFEIHMSNRAHRNAVRKRVTAFRRSLAELSPSEMEKMQHDA